MTEEALATILAHGKNRSRLGTTVAANGDRTDVLGRSVKNLVLLSLPDEEYSLIRPHLEFVDLKQYLSLQEPGENIEYGYFPDEGMVSLVIAASDGRSVEVGIAGKEGFVGGLLVVGLNWSPCRAIVQIAGNGLRVRASALEAILGSTPVLQLMLNRFAQMQGQLVAQIAACNRLHEIDQRMARWLLMSQDRVESEWLPITHDFLATMLGTGRPSVSLAAGSLQRAGLIEYMRGAVRVLDRKGLEGASCECYRVIQQFNGEMGLK
jgi:CRP-like cAMP-binding protein